MGALGAVVLGAVFGSSSCGESVSFRDNLALRLETAVCGSDCGCPGSVCSSWAAEEARRIDELLEEVHLTFDEECFAARLEAHAINDCRPPSWDQERRCGASCTLAYGTRRDRESCKAGPGFSSCQRGLVCFDERCVDPCARAMVGRSCTYNACPYPLRCDSDSSTCQAPLSEGEACISGDVCEGGLLCIDGTCGAPGEIAAPCTDHEECLSRNCPAGFCSPLPTEDESCAGAARCAVGLECEADVCVTAPQPGDPCPCASGQSCESGVCRWSSLDTCGAAFLVQ